MRKSNKSGHKRAVKVDKKGEDKTMSKTPKAQKASNGSKKTSITPKTTKVQNTLKKTPTTPEAPGVSKKTSTRDKLIQAGLKELEEYGETGFSTRRVAKACGVSCAAPYKHFKDTSEFISAILTHINDVYLEEQNEVMEKYAGCSSREMLVQVSLHYVRFLIEHSQFRRIVMQNFQNCDEACRSLRGQMSIQTYRVVSKYCKDVNMPPDVRERKTFIVRSIIYGAAFFFESGELEYTPEKMQMIEDMLNREFDLP